MSSGFRCRPVPKFSGSSHREISRDSHARSARASAMPALCQWRLLALTLPTTTLFCRTISVATSATESPLVAPPLPTPVRHITPPGPSWRREPPMTVPTPVHSMMTSGSNPISSTLQLWYVAPRARTNSGLGPDSTRSSTLISKRRCFPSRAASKPIGPAPVTSTVLGSQKARWPTAITASQALATTVVGSSRTPSSPRELSTLIAYSGSILQRLRHVAVNLFNAALGILAVATHIPFSDRAIRAGYGIGAAHDADHEIAFLQATRRVRLQHATERLVPEYEPFFAGRRPAILALRDLNIGSADADGDGLHEH